MWGRHFAVFLAAAGGQQQHEREIEHENDGVVTKNVDAYDRIESWCCKMAATSTTPLAKNGRSLSSAHILLTNSLEEQSVRLYEMSSACERASSLFGREEASAMSESASSLKSYMSATSAASNAEPSVDALFDTLQTHWQGQPLSSNSQGTQSISKEMMRARRNMFAEMLAVPPVGERPTHKRRHHEPASETSATSTDDDRRKPRRLTFRRHGARRLSEQNVLKKGKGGYSGLSALTGSVACSPRSFNTIRNNETSLNEILFRAPCEQRRVTLARLLTCDI